MSTSTSPSTCASTSTSTSVKRTFDQVEELSTAVITITKDYNYYLDLSNWQLNTEVDEDAYVEGFLFLLIVLNLSKI